MPSKNFLSSETRETLQQVLKEHEHPDIRQRALIFLLLTNSLLLPRVCSFSANPTLPLR